MRRLKNMSDQLQQIIEIKQLIYRYDQAGSEKDNNSALDGITLSIDRGEFVAVVGRNGSGKSTLAHLLNALLLPTSGTVSINGCDTRDVSQRREIRRQVGMIFQCPDNQIIGATVLEDVAFGLENLGVAPDLIEQQVLQALQAVDMVDQADCPPDTLSASQKQKLCIASILAMEPTCIILDESTTMLDHNGKNAIMALLHRLNRDKGLTALHCTHDMEEALQADRVIVLDQGMIKFDGTPTQLFTAPSSLQSLGLESPPFAELLDLLRQDGHDLPSGIVSATDAVTAIATLLDNVQADADPA